MDLMEAMRRRHSVRAYQDRPLGAAAEELQRCIEQCNRESGLHIQLVQNEPKAFAGRMARYGHFSNVKNYIVLIGKKGERLEEQCGYYGEKIVLRAQQMGLNTCWVALTYQKIPEAFTVAAGEKLVLVIAVGYGESEGTAHKSKSAEAVSHAPADAPQWFRSGVEAALLAPTAVNQQKFSFSLTGQNRVSAKAGFGFYTKVDLGIAKYHFELAAGTENFTWL